REDALPHAGCERRTRNPGLQLAAVRLADACGERAVLPAVCRQVPLDRLQLLLEARDVLAPLVPLVPVRPGPGPHGHDQQRKDCDPPQILPARQTPHISHSPRTPAMKNPKADTTLSPSTCGPDVAKTPIRLEPISPAATTNAMISRLIPTSSCFMKSSSPLWTKPTSIWPSRACSRMSCTWYGYSAKTPASLNDSRRTRLSMRCGV